MKPVTPVLPGCFPAISVASDSEKNRCEYWTDSEQETEPLILIRLRI
jgi:hypothetical protein